MKGYATKLLCTSADNEYEISLKADMTHDRNYAADADGNRGVPMDFVDDEDIVRVQNTRTKRVIPIEILGKRKVMHEGRKISLLDKIFHAVEGKYGIDYEPDDFYAPDNRNDC